MAALERDRFDELAEANATRYVIVQEFLHLPFQLLLKLNILCRFLFIHSLVNLHVVILARPEYQISQSLGFLYLTLPSLQLLTALQVRTFKDCCQRRPVLLERRRVIAEVKPPTTHRITYVVVGDQKLFAFLSLRGKAVTLRGWKQHGLRVALAYVLS